MKILLPIIYDLKFSLISTEKINFIFFYKKFKIKKINYSIDLSNFYLPFIEINELFYNKNYNYK